MSRTQGNPGGAAVLDDRPLLDVRGVSKRYGRHSVLRDVSFSVRAGQSLAIIGANGCGKSTMLKICAGLLSPSSGSVHVRGRVAYCPQQAGLSEFLTPVDHAIWFGAGTKKTAAQSQAEARGLMAQLDSRMPSEQVRFLSGGTVQKLNLICSVMAGPGIILLDEPYQGFDEGSYLNFWDLVESWQAQGMAVVVVTHMLRELHRVSSVLDLSSQARSRPVRAPAGYGTSGARHGVGLEAGGTA